MEEFQLEQGERVIRTVRKHWFALLLSLLPYALLAFLPTLLISFLTGMTAANPGTVPLLQSLTPANPWFRLFLGLWWLSLWIGAFTSFTQYYLNHWVITTLRIVRIRQHGFFAREVASFHLIRVQDVTTEVNGIFADLLGYGHVRVQTAGTASKNFVMDGIDDPQGMRDLIMSEIAAQYREKSATFIGMHT